MVGDIIADSRATSPGIRTDTAYHSFIGEVGALNTTTIRRLTRSRRHQLLPIAQPPTIADFVVEAHAL